MKAPAKINFAVLFCDNSSNASFIYAEIERVSSSSIFNYVVYPVDYVWVCDYKLLVEEFMIFDDDFSRYSNYEVSKSTSSSKVTKSNYPLFGSLRNNKLNTPINIPDPPQII
jgi:hypothetical protein